MNTFQNFDFANNKWNDNPNYTGPYNNSFTYDANGNQITRDINSGDLEGYYELNYDAENRLISVTKDNTPIAAFVYDGDGKQVKYSCTCLQSFDRKG